MPNGCKTSLAASGLVRALSSSFFAPSSEVVAAESDGWPLQGANSHGNEHRLDQAASLCPSKEYSACEVMQCCHLHELIEKNKAQNAHIKLVPKGFLEMPNMLTLDVNAMLRLCIWMR